MGKMTGYDALEPWIRVLEITLAKPSLKDNTADLDRILKALRKDGAFDTIVSDLSLVKRIPGLLRESGYRGEAVLHRADGCWHLIDFIPAGIQRPIYGLAVDLGTTTVVLELVDLRNRKSVDSATFHNPQIKTGVDILSRIHFASSGMDAVSELQKMVIEGINARVGEMMKALGAMPESVVAISVAGNTTMTHMFLGITPYWICREPYIPAANRFEGIKALDLGLAINPLAPVQVFPNIGSYFGGDLIAGILASGMGERSEISILVDVGTNAEVVIGNNEWLMACAGAAGPALEGGVAAIGMMAAPGAIDKVLIKPGTHEFTITTIGNIPPIGICGSGLIDLTAQMFIAGMLDIRGKLVLERCSDRLIYKDEIPHFRIVPASGSGTGEDLTISQPDIDALIRSKAAMYTILTTITNTVNIPLRTVERFYVAGTFGSYIDPRSAITIGMIPDLPLSAYVSLGNTSLKGAKMALLSRKAAEDASGIRDRITYLELNVNREFMNLFSAAKFLPHTDTSLFPSVRRRQD